MEWTARAVRLGKSQWTIGAIKRDVCSKEARSLEAEKITAIQAKTGTQYSMKTNDFGTADESKPGLPGAMAKRAGG
jgi:hypothetical protein